MDESRTRHVPWYVHAFAACVAAIGISLGLIFGFGIRSAFAFEWGNETFPDSLADVTVTFNDTLTEPPNGITNTWYTGNYYPMTNTLATPNPNQYAGATHIWMENYASVQSGNPWYIYFNCGPSLSGITMIPTGLDYGARLAYDAVAGWWGTANGKGPTVTFSSQGIGANAAIYTNQSFIVWVVENSDYRTRYEGGTWNTPQVVFVGYGVAWVVPTENVEFNVALDYREVSTDPWTVEDYQSPATYEGSFTMLKSGQFRLRITYQLNNEWHTEIYPSQGYYQSYYQSEESQPLQIAAARVAEGFNGQVYIDARIYNAALAKIQYSTDGITWIDSNIQFVKSDPKSPIVWKSADFVPLADTWYRIYAEDENGNFVYSELGKIAEEGTSSEWPGLWNDAWGTLQPILNTFSQIFGALFGWIPQDLREFLLALIMLMVVLGLISRIIP